MRDWKKTKEKRETGVGVSDLSYFACPRKLSWLDEPSKRDSEGLLFVIDEGSTALGNLNPDKIIRIFRDEAQLFASIAEISN